MPSPTETTALSPAAERRIRRAATGFVIFVALAAAVLSFTGLYELALSAGFNRWIAPLFPLATDVGVAAFSLAVLHHSLTGLRVWYPWACMLLGVAVSVAGNVWAAPANDVSRLVHGWAPILFALSFEALTRLVRHRVHVAQTTATPGEPPSAPAAVRATIAVDPEHSPPSTPLSPPAVAHAALPPAPTEPPAADHPELEPALDAAEEPAVAGAGDAPAAEPSVTPLEPATAPEPATVPARSPAHRAETATTTPRAGSTRERVAALLAAEPDLGTAEIARRLGADPSNVSKIVRRLRADQNGTGVTHG